MTTDHSDIPYTDIGAALLSTIGQQMSDPSVALDGPLKRLEGGFDTDTFLVSLGSAPNGWPTRAVLRLYRAGTPAGRAQAEAAAQRVVAAQGVPSAPVLLQGDDLFGGSGDARRPFMLMKFAAGGTLLSQGLRPSPFFFRMMGVMANLLADLHQLDPAPLRREFEAAGLDPGDFGPDRRLAAARARLVGAESEGLLRVGEWLETHRPSEEILERSVICHGDFHPLNILVDQGRVSALIDWSNVSVAPVEYDLAILRLIARYGPLELLGPIRWVIDLFRGYLMRRFDVAYRARQAVDEDLLHYYEVHRAFLAVTQAAYGDFQNYAWAEPHTYARLGRLISQNTGIDLVLPPLPS